MYNVLEFLLSIIMKLSSKENSLNASQTNLIVWKRPLVELDYKHCSNLDSRLNSASVSRICGPLRMLSVSLHWPTNFNAGWATLQTSMDLNSWDYNKCIHWYCLYLEVSCQQSALVVSTRSESCYQKYNSMISNRCDVTCEQMVV